MNMSFVFFNGYLNKIVDFKVPEVVIFFKIMSREALSCFNNENTLFYSGEKPLES